MSTSQNFPTISPSLSLDFANVQALDPRITYTRASTATYYGTRTAKAEENLLLQSQTFDNASWLKGSSTVTANTTTAPDGTSTADTVARSGTTVANVSQAFTATASSYVASVFAKAGTQDFLALQVNTNGTTRASFITFNLTDGSIGTEQTLTTNVGLTATATSFGNGWYRCSVVYTSLGGSDNILFNPASAINSRNGTDGGTLFLWGAQLEQRSAVTAYTVTTTQPITNYIPVLESAASGVARFDHNPTTFESLGFLIEESRSNLLTYSEDFADASWTKGDATITSNTIIAPDGTLTGDKLVENTNNAVHYIVKSITKPSVNPTVTIYAKAAGRNWVLLQPFPTSPNDFVNDALAYFDLANGAVGTVTRGTASITSVGNGWYRCSLTMSQMTSTASTNLSYAIYSATANGTSSYTGNGFDGVYIWGAQLEAGAFATSYIPTVASQVTRAADAASMTGTNFSSWFNNAEGTLYGEAASIFGNSVRAVGIISNGTVDNRIELAVCAGTNNGVGRFTVASSGTTQADSGNVSSGVPLLVANSFYKLSGSYKPNDFAWSFASGTVGTDTSGVVPVNQNQLSIGSRSDGLNLNGRLRKFAYYPLRLTNAQLQAITG